MSTTRLKKHTTSPYEKMSLKLIKRNHMELVVLVLEEDFNINRILVDLSLIISRIK